MADRVARSLLVRRDELQGERVVLHEPAGLGADVRRGQPERADDRRRRRHHHPRRQPARSATSARAGARGDARIDHISFGISPWDTDGVKAELEKRGLTRTRSTRPTARRDSRRAVQELSHGDAERVQPADQLQHARQPAGAAERGEPEGHRREVGTLAACDYFSLTRCPRSRRRPISSRCAPSSARHFLSVQAGIRNGLNGVDHLLV